MKRDSEQTMAGTTINDETFAFPQSNLQVQKNRNMKLVLRTYYVLNNAEGLFHIIETLLLKWTQPRFTKEASSLCYINCH